MSQAERRSLSHRWMVLALMLGCFAFVLAKPPKALAFAPSCEEIDMVYADCLNQCANYPNVGGYCASQPNVTDQASCYAFANQYLNHWQDCGPQCCYWWCDYPDPSCT
jgi:hypothetical protein